ncbi:hypothetical protein LTR22_027994 [Elasticomyces elasticus]|nr:hypothetical protein LTR22_027994 [Elasticomyces elasticus]
MLHRTVERKRHYTQIVLQKEQHATFLEFSPHHSTYRTAIENDVAEATKQCSAEQTRMRDLEGRFETLILYCQNEAKGCARQRRELVQQWVKEYTTFGQCTLEAARTIPIQVNVSARLRQTFHIRIRKAMASGA